MDTCLYYECHVTIEPVFDEQRDRVQALAETHGFRLAALLMKKRSQDTEERSSKDTFMTKVVPSTPEQLEALAKSMKTLVYDLQLRGFKVWRYKIEAALIDSRNRDVFELLPGVPSATTPKVKWFFRDFSLLGTSVGLVLLSACAVLLMAGCGKQEIQFSAGSDGPIPGSKIIERLDSYWLVVQWRRQCFLWNGSGYFQVLTPIEERNCNDVP